MPRLLYVSLITLSLIWGGSFFFIKMLLHNFGPWTIAFVRSCAGLLTIGVIMLALRKPFALRTIPWVPMTAMALVNTAIPWSLIGFSETRLTSSMTSILNATTPVWTIIVGVLFFKTRSSRNQWLGIGVATIGLLILLGVRPDSIVSVNVLGLAFMLTAAFCYGIGTNLSKRLLQNYSMYQISFGTLLVSTIGCGIMAFSFEQVSLQHIGNPVNISLIIGLGAFGSGVAYILYYYMIQKGSPQFASMVTYLVPSTALIWGYSLLNEPITWNMIVGLLVILGGVFWAGKKPASRTRTAEDAAL